MSHHNVPTSFYSDFLFRASITRQLNGWLSQAMQNAGARTAGCSSSAPTRRRPSVRGVIGMPPVIRCVLWFLLSRVMTGRYR